MALLESLTLPLNTPIIPFHLPSTDGKSYKPDDFKDKKILVIIFMCNHCPYVKAVIDRLIQLQKDYGEKGVQLIGINANDSDNYPEDSFEAMQKWVKEKNINFPYLHDESQEVAKKYQAQCTPDLYLFNQNRELAYHGRIDDNWKDPSAVTKKDLREALNALLSNQPISKTQIPSMGCSIKWKAI